MKHNRNDYLIDRDPALRPEDLEGKNAAVLTVAVARGRNIPDSDSKTGTRFQMVLKFEEFPDHQFYVNAAGMTAMIETYGEEDQHWVGREVPLVVRDVTNPKTNSKVSALHIAPLGDWKAVMSGTGEVETEAVHQLSVARARKQSAAKKETAPRKR